MNLPKTNYLSVCFALLCVSLSFLFSSKFGCDLCKKWWWGRKKSRVCNRDKWNSTKKGNVWMNGSTKWLDQNVLICSKHKFTDCDRHPLQGAAPWQMHHGGSQLVVSTHAVISLSWSFHSLSFSSSDLTDLQQIHINTFQMYKCHLKIKLYISTTFASCETISSFHYISFS